MRVQSAEELRLETPQSFAGSILDDVGFRRPAVQATPEGDTDFTPISLERIEDCDGDVVFVLVSPPRQEMWEAIEAEPLWQSLEAVQAGRVFVVDFDWWGAANYYGAYRILDDLAERAEKMT